MKVLMVHGINTPEVAATFEFWIKAIRKGLNDKSNTPQFLEYNNVFNTLFTQHKAFISGVPDQYAKYQEAANKLLTQASWYSDWLDAQSKAKLSGQPTPHEDFISFIRWTAVMTAQWIMEPGIRESCRNILNDKIKNFQPDMICAHSLGSLICYDYFTNDSRCHSWNNGVLLTFGSQISNPVVLDGVWQKPVVMPNLKQWCNLYNPNDPVFVVPIAVASANFYKITTEFGRRFFDISAHNAAWTNEDNHTGYLDNTETFSKFWK